MTPTVPAVERPPVDALTRFSYAFGGAAYGIKGNGYSYFLMLCYGQAFNMPSAQVGFALMLAFLFDAFSDPIVGYLSDNTKSPLGRRHIYMYGAALPVALAFWLLWNPPDILVDTPDKTGLFWFLVVVAIGVRLLITFYEVPCTALAAELTTDYDDRTRLLTLRSVFVFSGGVVMAASALFLILDSDATGSAFTDAEGFGVYGFFAALAIFTSIMVCALGTHRHIPYLHKASSVPQGFGKAMREVYETLKNPSLLALFASQLAGAAAFGIGAALIYYLHGFYWEFSGDQSAIITASVLASALTALAVTSIVSKKLGKREGAILFGLLALVLAITPVSLRLVGVMPANESPVVFWIVLLCVYGEYTGFIAMSALVRSMIADLAEDNEIRTGRRSEGVLFSVLSFTRKAVDGIGIMAAALILTLISWPTDASPGEVSPDALSRLALFYVPAIFVFWAIMLLFIGRYRINRADHEENLRALSARAAAQAEDHGSHSG